MVGVRVRVGVKFNSFYFLSHLQPAEGVRYEIQNGTDRDAGMFCDRTAGKTDKLCLVAKTALFRSGFNPFSMKPET